MSQPTGQQSMPIWPPMLNVRANSVAGPNSSFSAATSRRRRPASRSAASKAPRSAFDSVGVRPVGQMLTVHCRRSRKVPRPPTSAAARRRRPRAQQRARLVAARLAQQPVERRLEARPPRVAEVLDDRLAVEALAAAEGVHAILREDKVEPRVQVAVQLHRLLLEVARADDADRVPLAQRAEHIYGGVVGALRRHRERGVDVEEDEGGAVLAVGEVWRHRGGEGF